MERMQPTQRGYGRRYSNPYSNQNIRQNMTMRSNISGSCAAKQSYAADNCSSPEPIGCSKSIKEKVNTVCENRAEMIREAANTCPCTNKLSDSNSLNQFPLAMAYVPWQTFSTTYPLCEALEVGTIFPELDFPFEKARCQRR